MTAAQFVPQSFIDSTMSFVSGIVGSQHLLFFWLDSRCSAVDCTMVNISHECQHFMQRMGSCDPLTPRAMIEAGSNISYLSSGRHLMLRNEYRGSLRRYHFVDEIDVILCSKGNFVAGISAFRHAHDAESLSGAPSFRDIVPTLERSIPYIEFNLGRYLGANRQSMLREFADIYALTRREAAIAELIGTGCTNPDIARHLGVGLATVKTHICNLFRKVGVDNRSSLVSLLPR